MPEIEKQASEQNQNPGAEVAPRVLTITITESLEPVPEGWLRGINVVVESTIDQDNASDSVLPAFNLAIRETIRFVMASLEGPRLAHAHGEIRPGEQAPDIENLMAKARAEWEAPEFPDEIDPDLEVTGS